MRNRALLLILSLLLIIFNFAAVASQVEILTLEDALNRINYHSDVKAWEDNLKSLDKTLQGLDDKQKIGLNVSGNILSYSYDLDNENHSLSTGQGISISKANLSGTNLSASFSPSWSYKLGSQEDASTNLTWSFSLNQKLWPPAKLNSDQISLTITQQNIDILEKQKDYVLTNAKFKIQELYHAAQLGQEKIQFAQANLANAERTLQMALEKQELGESSETEIISAEIGVLRAERELEASLNSAENAKEKLLDSLELDGNFALEKIDINGIQRRNLALNLDGLKSEIEVHPLIQHYSVELAEANLDLNATLAAEKPSADLAISIDNKKTFSAYINVGHAIFDKNQRVTTRESREENLEKLEKSYEEALENLLDKIEEANESLKKLERDLAISKLTLRQAELELDVAKERFAKGIIDQTSIDNAKLALKQAQLDYYEIYFTYDLTLERLNQGILGDLSTTGGLK